MIIFLTQQSFKSFIPFLLYEMLEVYKQGIVRENMSDKRHSWQKWRISEVALVNMKKRLLVSKLTPYIVGF